MTEAKITNCKTCNAEIINEPHEMFGTIFCLESTICTKCYDVEKIKKAKMEHDREIAIMVHESRIPKKYFELDKSIAKVKNQKRLFDFYMKSINKSAYLSGGNGSGKTHITCNTAYKIIRHKETPILYIYAPRWLERLMHAKVNDDIEYQKELNAVYYAKLLIFDDIGKEKLTESKLNTLLDVIDYREVECKPIWFISNFTINGLISRIGDNAGNAIKSRIENMVAGNIIQ